LYLCSQNYPRTDSIGTDKLAGMTSTEKIDESPIDTAMTDTDTDAAGGLEPLPLPRVDPDALTLSPIMPVPQVAADVDLDVDADVDAVNMDEVEEDIIDVVAAAPSDVPVPMSPIQSPTIEELAVEAVAAVEYPVVDAEAETEESTAIAPEPIDTSITATEETASVEIPVPASDHLPEGSEAELTVMEMDQETSQKQTEAQEEVANTSTNEQSSSSSKEAAPSEPELEPQDAPESKDEEHLENIEQTNPSTESPSDDAAAAGASVEEDQQTKATEAEEKENAEGEKPVEPPAQEKTHDKESLPASSSTPSKGASAPTGAMLGHPNPMMNRMAPGGQGQGQVNNPNTTPQQQQQQYWGGGPWGYNGGAGGTMGMYPHPHQQHTPQPHGHNLNSPYPHAGFPYPNNSMSMSPPYHPQQHPQQQQAASQVPAMQRQMQIQFQQMQQLQQTLAKERADYSTSFAEAQQQKQRKDELISKLTSDLDVLNGKGGGENEKKLSKEELKELSGKSPMKGSTSTTDTEKMVEHWRIEHLHKELDDEKTKNKEEKEKLTAQITKLKENLKERVSKVREQAAKKLEKTKTKSREMLQKEKSKRKELLGVVVGGRKRKRQKTSDDGMVSVGTGGDMDMSESHDEDIEGSDCNLTSAEKKKKHTEISRIWMTHYDSLKLFQEEFGHCNVPRSYINARKVDGSGAIDEDKRKLYNFVGTNRTNHRKMRQGRVDHNLTPKKIQLLNTLGFKWDLGPPLKLPWEERYNQLKVYAEEFGNCDVAQNFKRKGFDGIGNWVMQQRRAYRSGNMNAERILKLEQVGFKWTLRDRGGTLEERMIKSGAIVLDRGTDNSDANALPEGEGEGDGGGMSDVKIELGRHVVDDVLAGHGIAPDGGPTPNYVDVLGAHIEGSDAEPRSTSPPNWGIGV